MWFIVLALSIVTLYACIMIIGRILSPTSAEDWERATTGVFVAANDARLSTELDRPIPYSVVVPDPIDEKYSHRERGWMQTYSGRQFYPLNPSPDAVELADVAHGLAMTCRYGGQAKQFYSVAEHCVIVSHFVETHARNAGCDAATIRLMARHALLHDSAEAYIGDMIRPLKHQPEMVEFRNAEAKIEVAIFAKFGIEATDDSHAAVKNVDNRILIDEITRFMPNPSMYLDTDALRDLSPLGVQFHAWSPREAEGAFLRRYNELFR